MTKAELIQALATKADLTKATTERVLDALTAVTTDALDAGEELTIPGVVKMSISVRAARTGRNPATGAEIDIPAARIVKFKVVKALKDAVA